MLITTTKDLKSFCQTAQNCTQLCVDSEFIGDDCYFPSLELVQINADDNIALIDYPALEDKSPLWELLHQPEVRKVFHAAGQDLSIFYQESGRKMTNTFDTQIAAAFLGIGEQIGYGDLVRTITGEHLAKGHSYTHWNKRPFTDAQLAYASDDVQYLPAVTQELEEGLVAKGRLSWAVEEFEALETSSANDGPVPEEAFFRVKGAFSLDGKHLAILRELAIWRLESAKRLNRPLQRVVRDDALLNIARHPPTCVDDLKNVRGLNSYGSDWFSRGIIESVKTGEAVPKESWPKKPKSRGIPPQATAILSLLQSCVRIRAQQEQVAWGLLAVSQELEDLAQIGLGAKEGDLKVLSGWRFELVGKDLLRIMSGDLALKVNGTTGKPELVSLT